MKQFSILITTKNRLEDLKITLQKINYLIEDEHVETIICDDGSNDDTYNFIQANYPRIQLIQNKKSKGLIFSRNRLLNMTTAKYAISLDDDAHFLTKNPLNIIENHFKNNPKCGVIACRIYWDKKEIEYIKTDENVERVKGFVGCGHIWNMKVWKSISNYPDWFIFYGEEEYAAFELFKNNWEVHYVPQLFVQHRVNIKLRKKNKDYRLRLRRSLRSGWYLYFLFYPFKEIPKRFLYSLWAQLKLKVFKGNFKALVGILQALFDMLINLPRIIKNSNRLSSIEYKEFQEITDTKIYWMPKNSQK